MSSLLQKRVEIAQIGVSDIFEGSDILGAVVGSVNLYALKCMQK